MTEPTKPTCHSCGKRGHIAGTAGKGCGDILSCSCGSRWYGNPELNDAFHATIRAEREAAARHRQKAPAPPGAVLQAAHRILNRKTPDVDGSDAEMIAGWVLEQSDTGK